MHCEGAIGEWCMYMSMLVLYEMYVCGYVYAWYMVDVKLQSRSLGRY